LRLIRQRSSQLLKHKTMSIKQVLKDKKEQFASAGISEVDAELILAFVLGVERMELHVRDFELNLEQVELFDELISKRISGKPTQYLIGHAPFRYLTFQVGQGVLIPRPESEALVEAALIEIEKIHSMQGQSSKTPVSVVDLGSGSGHLPSALPMRQSRRIGQSQLSLWKNQMRLSNGSSATLQPAMSRFVLSLAMFWRFYKALSATLLLQTLPMSLMAINCQS